MDYTVMFVFSNFSFFGLAILPFSKESWEPDWSVRPARAGPQKPSMPSYQTIISKYGFKQPYTECKVFVVSILRAHWQSVVQA